MWARGDVNHRANDSKNNNKTEESTTILAPLRNVIHTDQGQLEQDPKVQNNNEGDGNETDFRCSRKRLLFYALGLSSDAKYYVLLSTSHPSSIKQVLQTR